MPETAAGRALMYGLDRLLPKMHADSIEKVDSIEDEARALGRAEALAAVRAAVEGLGLLASEAFYEKPPTGQRLIELLRKKEVLAAIDNLETP